MSRLTESLLALTCITASMAVRTDIAIQHGEWLLADDTLAGPKAVRPFITSANTLHR
ncbi:hypothetical protein [Rudaeicoccus suwonensis]|uniref:Uncharacterized protein n=1 Tax=Rudaeicoccus suwonensis TaxID=657409 RepID=A0A561EC86_9MICO|nr:hypothetical protein [Rudaeicoccus suwonensis]TWE13197.1 hypothetical protein BKA23_2026 [Rudaeicoccus suwonensis]